METVQIARSVSSNEIENENEVEAEKITTYKPKYEASSVVPLSSTTTTTTTSTTTTTEAPTHNEEGVNIEKVSKNDVKIFAAPSVAAFTVQQDARGQPKNVIPIVRPLDQPPQPSLPVQQFSLNSPIPISTDASNTNIKTVKPTLEPIHSTTPFVAALSSSPAFSLSQSLELPTTKDAAFSIQQYSKSII